MKGWNFVVLGFEKGIVLNESVVLILLGIESLIVLFKLIIYFKLR